MYGYIRQPDGVLKPIQLDSIKNIFREGNSLNIVYFQVGSTPLEIPRVDQSYYYTQGDVKTCIEDPSQPGGYKTDLYTLSSTDFVNGDIKISFGDTHLDILDVFTKWMNSILSGVVHATSDITLNDYAPMLKPGYVFSAESSLPTVMAYLVPEGDDPCEAVPAIADSVECVVASDLTINATPPVHTNIFKTIWNETDKTLNLEPLIDGNYILFQWIAAEQCANQADAGCDQPCAAEGSGSSPAAFRNAIASNPGSVLVNVFRGAIGGYTICEANIQQIFTSDRTSYTPDLMNPNDPSIGTLLATPNGGQAYAISNPGCCGIGTGGVWPTATAPDIAGVSLSAGDYYNSSDFRIRQTGLGVTWPTASNGNGTQISGYENDIGSRFCDEVDTNTYAQDIVVPSIISIGGQDGNPTEADYNATPVINPTFGKTSVYPFSINQIVHGEGIFIPQLGISGINMNVLTIPAGTYNLDMGDPNPEFLIMNGVPTVVDAAEGGLYRLDETLSQSKLAGTTNPDSTYIGDTNPIFWRNGAPDSGISGGNAWITIKGINMRPLWRIQGSTWGQTFRQNYGGSGGVTNTFVKLQQAGIIPQGEEIFGFINELRSANVRIWQRNNGPKDSTDWTLYSPATTTASGLLPLMTNENYVNESGPPPWDSRNTAVDVVTIPILLEETDPKLLAAGFTHRAFGAGSMDSTTTNWSQGPQDQAVPNAYRIRGVGMTQSMSAPYSWEVAPIIQQNLTGNCS
tara:strand:+ start:2746 stop:4971 length:2226 start_codon:yes stop_codon:yes gene_type:complete